MFAIDLLQGKAKPVKIDLKRSMLKAVPFLIPVLAVAAWAASYQQDCRAIARQQAAVRQNQAVLDDSEQAIRQYRQMNGRLNDARQCLDVINTGLAYRLPVSDLLVDLVQGLPDDMFIYQIDLERAASMEKPPKDKDKKAKAKLVVRRSLRLQVCGFDPVKSDLQVRDYVEHLKTSPKLADLFSEVKPAARRQGMIDNRPATYYEIDCTLRKQD